VTIILFKLIDNDCHFNTALSRNQEYFEYKTNLILVIKVKGDRMKSGVITLSLIALTAVGFGETIELDTTANLRIGAIQIEDDVGKKSTTYALGGSVGVETKPIQGFSIGATFYTTNALFGKDDEGMFLGSNNNSYSIVGEAFIKAQLGKTTIKAGRQTIDTPYADSDDIGMVPDRFEGYSLVSKDIESTTIVLAWLDKWAGVDSEQPEKFREMQSSGDAVLTGGVIYKGVENTTLQAWQYKLENRNLTYLEAGYETEQFNLASQYSDQDNSNSIFGVSAGVNIGDLALSTAYNKVDGEVINGFGGGPFFTSAEDHTVAEVTDQEAWLLGAEYSYGEFTGGVTHVNFDKGENETDYILSYAMNDNFGVDVIYSDMYNDGKMTRVFANYNF